jgi:hypothetical protein
MANSGRFEKNDTDRDGSVVARAERRGRADVFFERHQAALLPPSLRHEEQPKVDAGGSSPSWVHEGHRLQRRREQECDGWNEMQLREQMKGRPANFLVRPRRKRSQFKRNLHPATAICAFYAHILVNDGTFHRNYAGG